ncbi:DoxX family protein [Streptomyces phaeochromogenes]|uniref:DoxX family protein n=1 Tax=Streptomyces phaeochromogenes TaxID=1923 RepID=UPI0036A9F173
MTDPIASHQPRAAGSGTGTDLAALILRGTLGPMLFAHGWNKVAGPGGLRGTTGWFESLGLKPASVHARLAAATEMTAGAALTIGAAHPLPAAAAVGLMAVAGRTDHRGKGFFVFKGGWEYTGVVAGAAVALATLGHGRYSVDRFLPRRRAGLGGALLAAGLGTAGAALLLKVSYRPEESPEPDSTAEAAETM